MVSSAPSHPGVIRVQCAPVVPRHGGSWTNEIEAFADAGAALMLVADIANRTTHLEPSAMGPELKRSGWCCSGSARATQTACRVLGSMTATRRRTGRFADVAWDAFESWDKGTRRGLLDLIPATCCSGERTLSLPMKMAVCHRVILRQPPRGRSSGRIGSCRERVRPQPRHQIQSQRAMSAISSAAKVTITVPPMPDPPGPPVEKATGHGGQRAPTVGSRKERFPRVT